MRIEAIPHRMDQVGEGIHALAAFKDASGFSPAFGGRLAMFLSAKKTKEERDENLIIGFDVVPP